MYDNFRDREPDELEMLDREIQSMARRRKEIIQNQKRQMEAKDERLVELAYELGLAKGHTVAIKTKLELTERKNKEQAEEISDLSDVSENRDSWKNRAIEAENKLEKLKKRKTTKRSK